jgi:hypothetical protein
VTPAGVGGPGRQVVWSRTARDAKIQVIDSQELGALNSAVECHLHTVEVIGSNPIAPTNKAILFNASA